MIWMGAALCAAPINNFGDSMKPGTYSLKQSLPVTVDGSSILIGLAPPNAIEIEEAPAGLADFLTFASRPHDGDELQAEASRLIGADGPSMLDELIEAEILVPYRIDLSEPYSRHDLFFDLAFGTGPGASAMLASRRVALIGVGGIGTNVALELVTAGLGTIDLVDADTVERSNLTRQYLFTQSDIGSLKIESASKNLLARSPGATVVQRPAMITGVEDLRPVFEEADFVVVSADTPQEVLEWSNQASVETGTPFACAGYQDTRGVVGPVVRPGVTACLACAAAASESAGLADDALSTLNLNEKYQAPSFGPLNAIVASTAVIEVMRFLLTGESELDSRRFVFDSLTLESSFEDFQRDPECPTCGH